MTSHDQENADESIWLSPDKSQSILKEYQDFLDKYQQLLKQALEQKTGKVNKGKLTDRFVKENDSWKENLTLCDPETFETFMKEREAKEKEERLKSVSPETKDILIAIEELADRVKKNSEEEALDNNLKSPYLNIESEMNWPKKSDGYGHQQFYQLVMGLKSKIRDRSLNEGLDPSIYEARLDKLLNFVSNLQGAFDHRSNNKPDSKKNEQVIWSHRPDYEVSGVDKENEPKINRATLLPAAATYLANPWLQDDQIDWIFLDSLIYAELAGYRELIFSGQALGKIHWPYMFSGGDIQKMAWYSIIIALARFALRYLVPPLLIIALYALQFETAFKIFGVAYVAYLVLRAALWPLRRRKEKLKDKAYKEHEDRLKKIMVAYWHCSPPVISLATLRTSLDEAIESGANFDGALFSILKRVETTRGEAFTPFTESV